jgi:hypothetical protein
LRRKQEEEREAFRLKQLEEQVQRSKCGHISREFRLCLRLKPVITEVHTYIGIVDFTSCFCFF